MVRLCVMVRVCGEGYVMVRVCGEAVWDGEGV